VAPKRTTILHRFYWLAWAIGTILIVLSWVGVVTPEVGLTGFVIACGTSLVAYFTSRSSLPPRRETVVLTREMLESGDAGYELAMRHLSRGGSVLFDGLAFAPRRDAEFCLVAAASCPLNELDEPQIKRDVQRVRNQFLDLRRKSPEVAAVAAGKTLRVILTSELAGRAVQVCQVVNGQIHWQLPGKGSEGSADSGV
jgi:hypothetical protein